MIYEIALDGNETTLHLVEGFLQQLEIPYYVEPPNRFVSLEDVKCQCEDK